MTKIGSRTGFIAAAAAALIVVIPVIAVIALGAYGSSIGGSSRSVGDSGSELQVFPGRGLPEEPVRLEGKGWPPRSIVDLFVDRFDSSQPETRLSIARTMTSRSGKFSFEAVVPTALIGPRTKSVQFEAESARSSRRMLATSSVTFEIDPFPNELAIEVFDLETGARLPDAMVQVLDIRGSVMNERLTGPNGSVRFANLHPGQVSVRARKLDYLRAKLDTSIPTSGAATASLALTPDPQRRIYVPYTASGGRGVISVAGVDRASGLRSDLEVMLPTGESGTIPSTLTMNFFFLMPDDPASSNGSGGGSIDQFDAALNFFWRSGIGFAPRRFRFPPYVWYAGRSNAGEAILMVEAPGSVALFDLIAVTAESDRPRVLTRYLNIYDVLPIVSPDGADFFLIDRHERTAEVVDIRSGKSRYSVTGLPEDVFRSAADPTGRFVYVLTLGGSVYRVDLSARLIAGPIAEVPGATWMAVSGDGATMYIVGIGLSVLTVVGLEDPFPVRLAPLDQSAEWVWADPHGPFIYTGWIVRPAVTLIDGESLEIAGYLDFTAGAGTRISE